MLGTLGKEGGRGIQRFDFSDRFNIKLAIQTHVRGCSNCLQELHSAYHVHKPSGYIDRNAAETFSIPHPNNCIALRIVVLSFSMSGWTALNEFLRYLR